MHRDCWHSLGRHRPPTKKKKKKKAQTPGSAEQLQLQQKLGVEGAQRGPVPPRGRGRSYSDCDALHATVSALPGNLVLVLQILLESLCLKSLQLNPIRNPKGGMKLGDGGRIST